MLAQTDTVSVSRHTTTSTSVVSCGTRQTDKRRKVEVCRATRSCCGAKNICTCQRKWKHHTGLIALFLESVSIFRPSELMTDLCVSTLCVLSCCETTRTLTACKPASRRRDNKSKYVCSYGTWSCTAERSGSSSPSWSGSHAASHIRRDCRLVPSQRCQSLGYDIWMDTKTF